MSAREMSQAEVLSRVKRKKLKLVEAAEALGLGYRQAKRLNRRYGAARGRTPTDWRLPALNRELNDWERIYNTVRPHQALGYRTPLEFLAELQRGAPTKGPGL